MKKFTVMLVLAAMVMAFAGCGNVPAETVAEVTATPAAPTATAVPTAEPTAEAAEGNIAVAVYIPNDNADGFDVSEEKLAELNAEGLMKLLIDAGVYPDTVAVNSCELTEDGGIALDMNEAFGKVLSGTGTAGELMYLGSLADTFLDAFDAQYITLTVNGAVLETGHNIYDFPVTWIEG